MGLLCTCRFHFSPKDLLRHTRLSLPPSSSFPLSTLTYSFSSQIHPFFSFLFLSSKSPFLPSRFFFFHLSWPRVHPQGRHVLMWVLAQWSTSNRSLPLTFLCTSILAYCSGLPSLLLIYKSQLPVFHPPPCQPQPPVLLPVSHHPTFFPLSNSFSVNSSP